MRNTSAGAWKALKKASRAVLHDSRNVLKNFGKLLAALAALLPIEILVSFLLVILAVLERQIAKGDFDKLFT